MLLAVVAASPGAISVVGTYIKLKKPTSATTRESNPAILAMLFFDFIFSPLLRIA